MESCKQMDLSGVGLSQVTAVFAGNDTIGIKCEGR
jgi:hypothetical protein